MSRATKLIECEQCRCSAGRSVGRSVGRSGGAITNSTGYHELHGLSRLLADSAQPPHPCG